MSAPGDYEFELTGGSLCLDFANTLGDRPRCCEEHLAGYDDLLSWARQADVLSTSELDALDSAARHQPSRAQRILEGALVLREAIFRIFAGLARSEEPEPQDVVVLNAALQAALPHLEIEDQPKGFVWTWAGPGDALDRPLWPVARSAADLLTSNEAVAIRECASDTCSWLFVDRSRTRRRRWCDMSTCGNRAKARRHYQRQKQSRSTR
jgi:predicted RNA-binding Zn ribbon-like protein